MFGVKFPHHRPLHLDQHPVQAQNRGGEKEKTGEIFGILMPKISPNLLSSPLPEGLRHPVPRRV